MSHVPGRLPVLSFVALFFNSSFLSFRVPDTGSVHGIVRFGGRCMAFLETWALYVCAYIISVSAPRSLAPWPAPGAVTQVWSFHDGELGGGYLSAGADGETEAWSRDLRSSSTLWLWSSHHRHHPTSLQTSGKRCPGNFLRAAQQWLDSQLRDIPGQVRTPQQQTLPPNPPSAPAPHHKSLPSIGRGPFKKDLLGGFKHRQRYGFINRKAIALIITGSFGGWHPRSPHSYGRANSPLPSAAASIAPLCLPVCGDHERGKSPDRECKCLFFVNEEHN